MHIFVENSCDHNLQGLNSNGYLEHLAKFVLHELNLSENCELSLVFISELEMQALNLEFRGKDEPTDILSFNVNDDCVTPEPDGRVLLGDIYIAPSVVDTFEYAYSDIQTSIYERLVIHGILHLCGFDHCIEEDALVMEAKEQDIAVKWSDLNKL
ncbi:MAG: rRNA maturation RNase YbeY [Coriobacteriales bacterium]|jgi:probable rRNA maturation factor|nr:rRNA maturation RNase YbeY [Coriobacteriales bacterium]